MSRVAPESLPLRGDRGGLGGRGLSVSQQLDFPPVRAAWEASVFLKAFLTVTAAWAGQGGPKVATWAHHLLPEVKSPKPIGLKKTSCPWEADSGLGHGSYPTAGRGAPLAGHRPRERGVQAPCAGAPERPHPRVCGRQTRPAPGSSYWPPGPGLSSLGTEHFG